MATLVHLVKVKTPTYILQIFLINAIIISVRLQCNLFYQFNWFSSLLPCHLSLVDRHAKKLIFCWLFLKIATYTFCVNYYVRARACKLLRTIYKMKCKMRNLHFTHIHSKLPHSISFLCARAPNDKTRWTTNSNRNQIEIENWKIV